MGVPPLNEAEVVDLSSTCQLWFWEIHSIARENHNMHHQKDHLGIHCDDFDLYSTNVYFCRWLQFNESELTPLRTSGGSSVLTILSMLVTIFFAASEEL